MLDLAVAPGLRGVPTFVWDVDLLGIYEGAGIVTESHCFACTAGAGSSCRGALETRRAVA